MSRFESITIREVESSDLETFYEHQLDPEAIRMAAFVGKDPKDKVAFDAHWNKILNSSQNTTRTIVTGGQVAGHIACYITAAGENMEVTYWLGREFWGRGLATQALNRMLPPCCRSANLSQGSNGQHRVDKSAAEMRFEKIIRKKQGFRREWQRRRHGRIHSSPGSRSSK